MGRFRKKPVEVEAFQWFQNGDHPGDGPADQEGQVVNFYRPTKDSFQCNVCGGATAEHGWIPTLEGGHIVCPGDWIVQGVVGERYACKPDIFDQTYEAA